MKCIHCTKAAACTFFASLLISLPSYGIDTAIRNTVDIDNAQSSSAAQAAQEAKERRSLDTIGPHREGEPGPCTGVDFIVKSVRLTRYTDRGTIGEYASIQNICSGSTTQPVRITLGGTHVWIRGGFLRGQVRGTGFVFQDNATRDYSVGPVTVTVNPSHEISEGNYSNNTCIGPSLPAGENSAISYCR